MTHYHLPLPPCSRGMLVANPVSSSDKDTAASAGIIAGAGTGTQSTQQTGQTATQQTQQTGGSAGASKTKTEAELEAERLYEERIEEEYAKREGGA
ncbi:uncharacterized protein EI97DRAFT_457357 [Westerdykella ornata]|uniref:Uncharacterized protein n=1 Tax=Westerdykella ornata TaxID=318751 RepID=A0A6A6JKZ8_WESOR|nr:uncharacterized protein EI97DRAFT_457357 [Westerdykella ornata]KAF2277330.1 hypothetical protein EI97DRAFT_457357 [Westerdykella ornata]